MAGKFNLKNYIREIPDFPKPGILFYDVTTLFKDKKAFGQAINLLANKFRSKKIDIVVATEARGFILGGALAYKLKTGFVPARKKGKLPGKSKSVSYGLEYGKDTLEMHVGAFKRGARILIVDDLLATGGTVKATAELIKYFGGRIVGTIFLIELSDLRGRDKLKGYPIFSLIKY